jgi:hypothetical protein
VSTLLVVSLVTTLVVGSVLAAWLSCRLARELERTRGSLEALRSVQVAHAALASTNARAARAQQTARASVPPAVDR